MTTTTTKAICVRCGVPLVAFPGFPIVTRYCSATCEEKREEAVRFFYEHAGYSVPPGKLSCAVELAKAEEWLERQEAIEFIVEPEDELSSATEEQVERIESGESLYVYARLQRNGQLVAFEQVLASLGGIEIESSEPTDGSGGYLRVIRAELAQEVI